MQLLVIKKEIKHPKNPRIIHKGEIYFVEDRHKRNDNNNFKYIKANDLIQPFDPNNKEITNVIITRAGGIGDIIAMSSLVYELRNYNVHFFTQLRFSFLFEWFMHKPILKEHTDPVFENYSPIKDFRRFKKWALIDLSNEIETGKSKNWFEIFFNMANIEFKDEYGRPKLKIPEVIKDSGLKSPFGENSVLLCPKATAQMRTIKLEDLHKIAIERYPEYKYFINIKDLFPKDVQYCADHNIEILQNRSIETAFIDLYFFDHVLGTDSMHIHFREGIGKGATGLYGAFDKDCRTKYYKHTTSVNIESDCDLQPCYLHENLNGIKTLACPKMVEKEYAPCMSYEYLRRSL